MRLEALIFDLDETIMPDNPSAEAAAVAAAKIAAERHGIDADALAASLFKSARTVWRASEFSAHAQALGASSWEALWGEFSYPDPRLEPLARWLPEYRLEAWSGALADHDITDAALALEVADAFRRERRARHLVFPEAPAALDDLARDYRLALLTNGSPDVQNEKIDGAGLRERFDPIVISGEVGAGKPEPESFRHILKLLGMEAEQTAMIGDSFRRDIVGAAELGMFTIWLNRFDKSLPADVPDDLPEADATVYDLAQIRGVLPE
jgi:putative hydrolase of the HAD superfamily